MGRDVVLRVSETVEPDYFSNPSLQISQVSTAAPIHKIVTPIAAPAAMQDAYHQPQKTGVLHVLGICMFEALHASLDSPRSTAYLLL